MKLIRALMRGLLWGILGLPAAHGAAVSDAIPLPVPDARPATYPEIASDGKGNFLLVWQQGRNYFEQQESDIFALRLDAASRPIGQPFAVCAAKGAQEHPQVAFVDGLFVVAWHDLRNGRDWDVYAARVAPDGTLRDPDGFLVAGGAANQASPMLAPAPDGANIVWQHYDGHYYELRGSSIGASGKVAPARALALRGETLRGGNLAISSFGDRGIMAWTDETKWTRYDAETVITRYFARVRLTQAGPEVLETARAPDAVLGRGMGRFVSDGTRAALYAEWAVLGRGQRMVAGAQFASDSLLAKENPNVGVKGRHGNLQRVISVFPPSPRIEGRIATAFSQGSFLVASLESGEDRMPRVRILGMRMSPAGMLLDDPGSPLVLHTSDRPIANPALAPAPDGFILVFEQDDGPDKQRLLAKSVRLQ